MVHLTISFSSIHSTHISVTSTKKLSDIDLNAVHLLKRVQYEQENHRAGYQMLYNPVTPNTKTSTNYCTQGFHMAKSFILKRTTHRLVQWRTKVVMTVVQMQPWRVLWD